MGWSNPPVPWAELERRLSGGPSGAGAGGGDSPAWSNRRSERRPPPAPHRAASATAGAGAVAYAELHCHSNLSFLDGASHPEELVEEAARLGLSGLALTDHDGFYGVVRFAQAAGALGLATVLGAELTLDLPRRWRRPYTSMEDLVRRTGATLPAVEALSTAGAFASLSLDRRQALWGAGAVAQAADTRLEGVVCGTDAPALPEMTEPEVTAADLWSTGVTPDSHVVQYARPRLDAAGAVSVAGLERVASGRRVSVGGFVTHRQRPAAARGTIFVNLEDETGMANVICNAAVWATYRRVARSSPALLISGRLERAEGVTNLIAEKIEALSLATPPTIKSRDFR